MNEIMKNIDISKLIYTIDEKQVIIDCDLAEIYNVETKEINQAVRRNKDKFPNRYCFHITENDFKKLKSQIVTSNGGSRKGHNVFTEQGVYMISTILKSKIAIETTILIMDSFVLMKKYISKELLLNNKYDTILVNHENRILLLEEQFNNSKKENNNLIFFKGQFYDAYSLLIDIFNQSENEIVIIDNYASKELLDIIKHINKKKIIISKSINDELIKKYKKQYNDVDFIYNNTFHDRFIIIDRKNLYHFGASLKNLGKGCFAINKMENQKILNSILEEIFNK